MIDKQTEQRIKDKANVLDVLSNYGIQMSRMGNGSFTCFSPFRDDRHMGSFVANERKNIVTDFATGEKWDAIKLVAQFEYNSADAATVKEHYTDILRILGAMYHETVDDKPVPTTRTFEPRPAPEPLKMQIFPHKWSKAYMGHESENPLLSYLLGIRVFHEDHDRLIRMIDEYRVGTYLKHTSDNEEWDRYGYCMFWQLEADVDGQLQYARDCKLMKYNANGKRWKDEHGRGKVTWMSSMTQRWKTRSDGTEYEAKNWLWDNHIAEPIRGLFGLHLIDKYPKAEILIVESEKSALICSMFTEPEKHLYLATAGQSNLTIDMLRPLLIRNKNIVLIPDKDSYEKWSNIRDGIRDYINDNWGQNQVKPTVIVSNIVNANWTEEDGPKADIADIMLRLAREANEHPITEIVEASELQKACERLELPPDCPQIPLIGELIDKLKLKIEE